jgi:hypothetical protein
MVARENWGDRTAEVLREWVENKDRVLRGGLGGGGADEFGSMSVGGKGGKCVLQALWIHKIGNDFKLNNPSTALSTRLKPIPIPILIRIHSLI